MKAAGGDAASRGPVVVRPPVAEDAPRLDELIAQLGYPSRPQEVRSRLERILAAPGDFLRVAELDGTVVGWVHAAEEELFESGRRCEIRGLVVDRATRRAGVGRTLLAAVEAWARGRGLPEASVRSNVVRQESHPFYERLGFARAKTQHVYRKPLR